MNLENELKGNFVFLYLKSWFLVNFYTDGKSCLFELMYCNVEDFCTHLMEGGGAGLYEKKLHLNYLVYCSGEDDGDFRGNCPRK